MNHIDQISRHILAERTPLIQERISRINEKLRAAGAPLIELSLGQPKVTGMEAHGVPGTLLTTVEVTLRRGVDAPIGQVELLGKTTIDPSSRFMSHSFFTKVNDEQMDFFDHPPHPCHCDHCNTQRNRTTVFIFQTADGLYRVGSGCADEFAGLQIKKWTMAFQDAVESLNEIAQIPLTEIRQHTVFKVDDFLSEAALVIGTMGYFSAKEHGLNSSGSITYNALIEKVDPDGHVQFTYPPHVLEKVKKVKEFIQASEYRPEDRNAEYFVNLRNLLTFGYMTSRQAGLLASSIRSCDIDEKKRAEADRFKSVGNAHVGTVGERTLYKNLRVDAYYHDENEFISTKIHFTDEKDNLFIWKRSGYHEPTVGSTVNLLGTLDSHKVWYSKKYQKDMHENRLTRCKELSPEEVLDYEAKAEKKAARISRKKSQDAQPLDACP